MCKICRKKTVLTVLNCKLNFVSTKQAISANLGVDRRVGPGSDWLAVEVVLDRLYATVVVRGRLGGQRVLLAQQTRSTEKGNLFLLLIQDYIVYICVKAGFNVHN